MKKIFARGKRDSDPRLRHPSNRGLHLLRGGRQGRMIPEKGPRAEQESMRPERALTLITS